jgi:hypothetical protein
VGILNHGSTRPRAKLGKGGEVTARSWPAAEPEAPAGRVEEERWARVPSLILC